MDDLKIFLTNVVTSEVEGYFQLLIGPDENRSFHEEYFSYPSQLDEIVDRINAIDETNVWFSPHLFSKPDSHKENVLPTRTLVVDLDNADVTDLRMNPSYLVETSPTRHQGYWILKSFLPPQEFELLSKQLTYTIVNADHSGWTLGHKFRLPGRRNFKYTPSPYVRIVQAISTERIYTAEEIRQWTADTDVKSVSYESDDAFIANPPTSFPIGPNEILEKYRSALGPKVSTFFSQTQANRHESLWALMLGMFRAGASKEEVYWLAKHSANNKFEQDQHFNADRDLAKDVDRAHRADTTDRSDIPELIKSAERAQGTNNDRKRLIAKIVIGDMIRKGEFISTIDGRFWYLHSASGRPMLIGRRSEQLDSLLDMSYGLNISDGFTPFVINHLQNYTLAKGREAVTAVLSYYDNTSLFLHSGKGDVYRITANNISRHPNGQFGVLFPWRPSAEEMIVLDDPISDNWVDWLFNDRWFDNLINFTPEQARILVRVWFLFLIFRDTAVARPIMTLIGEPGSGKSTLFHLLYGLLYGRNKSLNSITSADDFDFLVASDPLVVFDNVDSWTNWLPDKLALSASASDLIRRKLYTDAETITLRRQAMIGLTAHDPQFGRADVVDRMLIMQFHRRPDNHFIPESVLYDRIHNSRNKVWGAIVKDIQAVLREPDPSPEEIPSLRISDFARTGVRIAKALGVAAEFVNIVQKIRETQTAFSLAEDDILVDAIKLWHLRRNGTTPQYAPVGYLFEQFAVEPSFKASVKSSKVLSRKLQTMRSNLSTLFDIDSKYDSQRGIYTWRIDPK